MTTSSQSHNHAQDEHKQNVLGAEMEAMASLAEAFKQANVDDEKENPLAALEAQVSEYRDAAMRAAAELENTRKRAEREKSEANKYAIAGFARDLVSVYENLARASSSVAPEVRALDASLNTLATGVDMTLGELARVFEKYQIQRIDPINQPFDHNFHQAMTKIETTQHPEGTVVQVMQAAYVLHDRLLQPAFVGVATAPVAANVVHHVDTKA